MNILYLSLRLPYPPHRGDRIRAFNFLKHLSQKHTVSLIAFHDEGDASEAVDALRNYCKEITLLPLNKQQSRFQCCLYAWSSVPLQVRYWYASAMRQAVRRFLDEKPCDLIHVHFFRMAQYVTEFSEVPKLLDLCDALSLNLLRRAQLDRGITWPLLKLEANRVKRYEVEIMRHFQAGTLVSELDRTVLMERNPALPLHVLPMGVDLDYFKPGEAEKRSDILFTGTMNYFPNVDAVLFFYHEVLPRVKQAIPNARFVVAGSNPAAKLQRMANRPDFHLTGAVPDMRPYFSQASVFVSPMRAGSGMQTKNLEAMAMQLPVVTTPVGMEGLDAVPDRDLILAETPQEYAAHVIRLLRDEQERSRLGLNGRKLMEQQYSWEKIGQRLDVIYDQLVGQRS